MQHKEIYMRIALILFALMAAGGCSFDDTGKNFTNPNAWDLGDDVGAQPDTSVADSGSDDAATSDAEVTVDTGTPDSGDVGASECGNSIVEADEDCDDGNTSQDDDCRNDCTFACGDGVVNANAAEICDTGIAAGEVGACPSSCDDGDACTTGSIQGTGCQAECVYGQIAVCLNDDLCCAMGCNETTDNDCAAMCGNSVIETGEVCDPPGSCPASCNDNDACTQNVLSGSSLSCDAACSYPVITACVADGCCAAGCNSTNDPDCSVSCGNAVIEAGETCDPVASCPTACNDNNACTNDVLTGSAANCNAACTFSAKTGCQADGCCVPGCNAVNDADCSPICGNMVVELGEACDDGNANPNDACNACVLTGNVSPTAFLFTDIDVRDPHMFADAFGCRDITNQVFGVDGVNPQFQNAIQADGNNDGLLDLSLLAVFRPLNQTGAATGSVNFVEGDCTAPLNSTSCQPALGAVSVPFTYTNQSTGTCLDVVPGTTRATYMPTIATPSGPCFSTDAQTISLDLNGIIVSLQDARFGASYVGVPATGLSNGLLRGFLTQATAESIILPANLPLVGGASMASILRGHSTNCATGSDMDMHPTLGTGWWLYLNFPASKVTFSEP
jgi:cysteine-rich repeat protein